MGLFYVIDNDLWDAISSAVQYLSRVEVFVYPDERASLGEMALVQLTAPYEVRELTMKWSRVHSGAPAQDAAMCTFHIVNLTDDDPDATWITADYTTCEALFDTFWSDIKEWFLPATVLGEYVWRPDGPAFKPHGSSLQPTLRITSRAVAGTGTGGECPPQTAASVTEVIPATFVVEDVEGAGTQTRNRWGRFYLPAPSVNALAAGRWHADFAEDVALATQTLYNGLASADFPAVVYSPTTGSSWTVESIHVDDITDVIRRRRFVTPLSRHAKSITP